MAERISTRKQGQKTKGLTIRLNTACKPSRCEHVLLDAGALAL